jgi:hypothetical protein
MRYTNLMRYAGLGILGALAFLPAFAQVQLGRIQDKIDHGNGTAESTNWSGYAALGSSFTSAEGSWIVPAANCNGVAAQRYAAFWVGIDGYNSSTVEQTGTMTVCIGKTPSYYAWYEFYPKAMVEVTSVRVTPGDSISASVVYNSTTQEFTVTITDETTGRSYNTSSKVSGADRSSAEWIAEAPCCTRSGGILPLPNFGTASFGEDSTAITGTNFATDSSNSGSIGSFLPVNWVEINKTGTSSSPQISVCSALSSDGTSFTCSWGKPPA